MTMAAALFLVVINAISARDRARIIIRVMLAIGVIVSVIAVLEAAQVRAVLGALTVFRPGFHVVGGQLRATSTMLYPTIASMYLEVVFALGLWLLLEPRQGRAIVFAALAIVAAGITATFTRAGLIAMGITIAVIAVLHFAKARRVDRDHFRLAGLAATVLALVLLSRSPDVLLTRLQTEGSQDWYGATYSAPPTLHLRTGADYEVPVTLANTGRVIWDSSSNPMFAMSYHWLRADSEAVVQFEGWRTPFPAPVEPNASVTLPVKVRAPGAPGTYVLVWDVVHEHRAWLSTEGVAPARTIVTVEGERVTTPLTEMSRLPAANPPADRLTLWRAALAIAGDHPVLGIGPDNFRQIWGRYAGRERSDTRVHANNMYLELLAGAGIVGLAVFVWLLVTAGVALFARWRESTPVNAAFPAVCCAVLIAIVGHGLVDSFLSFTTTYVTFALAAGLAFSEDHAHRI
jgi:O-antigen ligase